MMDKVYVHIQAEHLRDVADVIDATLFSWFYRLNRNILLAGWETAARSKKKDISKILAEILADEIHGILKAYK